MKRLGCFVLALGLLGAFTPALAADNAGGQVSLTIYSAGSEGGGADGFAVVRELRKVPLEKGKNAGLRFDNVAATIDGTSVTVRSLTDPAGTRVLEQTFAYDLVSTDKLLERYLDKTLTLQTKDGKIEGTLLSYDAGTLVLKTADKAVPVQVVARDQNLTRIAFGELPGGLISKPTLIWDISAAKAATHELQVAYQATGLGWAADYSLVLNDKENAGDFSGWATINNHSGASFENASLKLVAGDVRRLETIRVRGGAGRKMVMMDAAAESDSAGFAEKSFFEYHLYTLGRPTTVLQNATKQIELFNAAKDVGLRKVLVYYGATVPEWYWGSLQNDRNLSVQGNTKVDVYVELKNKKENGLGLPLPKGKVRVFKKDDADGSLEFVGEDRIQHTAKDETVLLKLGQAFDVVGERKQSDYRMDPKNIWESFEITLRNHKKEAATVLVKENLYRYTNWELDKKADGGFKKVDSRTITTEVTIPPDGEKKISYTVHYFGW